MKTMTTYAGCVLTVVSEDGGPGPCEITLESAIVYDVGTVVLWLIEWDCDETLVALLGSTEPVLVGCDAPKALRDAIEDRLTKEELWGLAAASDLPRS